MAGTQKQVNFLQLSERGKQTVTRHEQYAKEICELINIRQFLIDQIHQKKSTKDKDTGRYTLTLIRTEEVYGDILFLKLDCVDESNDWSSLYRSDFQDILHDELDKKDRACVFESIYYHWEVSNCCLAYTNAPINLKEWTLSTDMHTWTNEDETIIARYIAKLYYFLTEKFVIIKKTGRETECHQKWIDRVKPLITAP